MILKTFGETFGKLKKFPERENVKNSMKICVIPEEAIKNPSSNADLSVAKSSSSESQIAYCKSF
jgi:hypothetical protein